MGKAEQLSLAEDASQVAASFISAGQYHLDRAVRAETLLSRAYLKGASKTEIERIMFNIDFYLTSAHANGKLAKKYQRLAKKLMRKARLTRV